jgi:hypothetical protein
MPDFISLSCPSCGAKLQVTEDLDRFACSHCGNEMAVARQGGIVTLKPVTEGLERIRSGTDKTASELAIVRLDKEIEQLEASHNSCVSRLDYIQKMRKEKRAKGVKYAIIVCASAMLIGSCFLCYSTGYDNPRGVLITLGILTIGGGIAGASAIIVLSRRDNLTEDVEIARKMTALESQLKDKSEQIKKHRDIVSRL